MAPSSRRRGFDAERELARRLWMSGFAVVRGPASGARARRLIYPDLVALYRGRIFVFEVKLRKDPIVYVDGEQLQRLMEFARRAGGEAYVAVKLPRRGWRIVSIDSLRPTAGGRYRIDEETLNNSMTLEEFINRIVNVGLDRFSSSGGSAG